MHIRRLTFILLILGFTRTVLAAPPDACKLLTLGDVQAMLGNGFAPAPGGMASDYSACTYKRGSGEVAGIIVLKGTPTAADALKERAKILGSKATPVTGLGEGAFRVAFGNIAGVWFGKGAWQANAEIKGSSAPEVAQVQKLAGIVLSRLP